MLRQYTQATAPDGQPFRVFSLTNHNGMQIRLMDWGASWLSCQVPVGGQLREMLLGCRLQDYPTQQAYLGATIGRYANRIGGARFRLNGETVKLTANQGRHQLHGGRGFDQLRWQVEKCGENFVRFCHFSAHGDQGFPGNVRVGVTYRLSEDNAVSIEFDAVADRDTPLNLTNHAYFNLNDAENGMDIRAHSLQLNADYFLPVDGDGIPNAPLKAVRYSSFDFTDEKPIGLDFMQEEQHITKGYDHAFLLNGPPDKPCAILTALDRSATLQVFTSQPALQVYSGNFLGATPRRDGGHYADYAGIALETQALPDTPNHPEWWRFGGISKAGRPYRHWTRFRFSC